MVCRLELLILLVLGTFLPSVRPTLSPREHKDSLTSKKVRGTVFPIRRPQDAALEPHLPAVGFPKNQCGEKSEGSISLQRHRLISGHRTLRPRSTLIRVLFMSLSKVVRP